MSPAARKALRVVIGIVAGFGSGVLLALCLLTLLFVICTADSDGNPFEPKHRWVSTLATIVLYVTNVLPLVGAVVGVLWAVRRNRRDSAPAS